MVQSLPGFLNLCLNVCSPCQVLGDVYTEVLEATHPLHRGPIDHKRSVGLQLSLPEVHDWQIPNSTNSQRQCFYFLFWLNPLNKIRGSHKLKIILRFILRHKTHQLHHTRDFFKLLHFLKKTVADKLLNGTTGAVGDIQRHHAKQFINLQYFPDVV